MRCVNPNVSSEEEISDSAEDQIFFSPASLRFFSGPVDALLTVWRLTERGVKICTLIERRKMRAGDDGR